MKVNIESNLLLSYSLLFLLLIPHFHPINGAFSNCQTVRCKIFNASGTAPVSVLSIYFRFHVFFRSVLYLSDYQQLEKQTFLSQKTL